MLHSFIFGTGTSSFDSEVLPVMSKSPYILLIDDDNVFIFLTKKMLMNTGLVKTIDVCESAEEAIQFLESIDEDEKMPDMIFLDLNMPEMNGWQFLETYQSLLPKMNKVPQLYVVSSSISENDCERAMNINGVTGYLAKPLEVIQLKVLLQDIIW